MQLDVVISTILGFLFSSYGKVPILKVKEKEHEVLATPFVPSDSMVAIYKPIEELRTQAKVVQIPYTESQIVDFGIQLTKMRHVILKQPSQSELKSRPNARRGEYSKSIFVTLRKYIKICVASL